MGFDFIVIAPLPSHCGFSFVFGCGVSFFGEFQCLPVDDCLAVSCDSSALTRGREHTSLYSTISNQSPLMLKYHFYPSLYHSSVLWLSFANMINLHKKNTCKIVQLNQFRDSYPKNLRFMNATFIFHFQIMYIYIFFLIN